MTASQFLDWAAAQTDRRFELENGEIVEMAAEQAQHALMKFSAAKALERGVREAGLPCTVFPDGMTAIIDDAHVRLPDAAVQCASVDPRSTVLTAPVILVEVVSPSSGSRDENFKLVEYFSLPAVEHYLVLYPEQRIVVHHRRIRQAVPSRPVSSIRALIDLHSTRLFGGRRRPARTLCRQTFDRGRFRPSVRRSGTGLLRRVC